VLLAAGIGAATATGLGSDVAGFPAGLAVVGATGIAPAGTGD
jgi:hypothetical protein